MLAHAHCESEFLDIESVSVCEDSQTISVCFRLRSGEFLTAYLTVGELCARAWTGERRYSELARLH